MLPHVGGYVRVRTVLLIENTDRNLSTNISDINISRRAHSCSDVSNLFLTAVRYLFQT